MAQDQRMHPRIAVPLKVSLSFSEEGQLFAVTRDISDGGIFLVIDRDTMPVIGDIVQVQVQGMGGGEDAPWVKMKVVREESDGIGLMIVD